MPQRNNGTPLGVLSLAARRNGMDYIGRDEEALQYTATVVAQAIEQDHDV